MKTVVISDLHIGDPRHLEDQVVVNSSLKQLEFDRLILNGDIIDLWADSLDNIKTNELFITLCEIAQKKDVVWIIGNHDSDIRYFPDVLPGAKMCDFYTINGEKKILILHGNHFYEHEDRSWYTRAMSKLNLLAWKVTRFLGRKWNYPGFDFQTRIMRNELWYGRYAHQRRRYLLNRYSKYADIVIMGHTHLVGYCGGRGTILYDAGSTTKTRTYAEISENCEVAIRKI